MKFKKVKKRESYEDQMYIQVEDDGSYKISCAEHYPPFIDWVEAGNTPEEADSVDGWIEIRSKRDQILRDTDWTMTTGATVDQAQWAAYRQVIRDIPQTYKDKTPDDVVWPTQPSTKGPNS